MGRKWDKFRLLMWKNFLIQWRHPKQTTVEILAPVVFCSLLVVVRSLVDPESHDITSYTPFRNNLTLNRTFTPEIAWSPDNSILNKIIKDFAQGMYEKHKIKVRPVSCKNSKDLEDYLSNEVNLIKTIAGIQFDDSLQELNTLHANVNVSFRFPSELRNGTGTWQTHLLFPTYQVPGPRDWTFNTGAKPSYYVEGFLILQQEISFSIIKYFKKEVKSETFDDRSIFINMQRFPYPTWVQDDLLTALQVFVGLMVMLSFVYTCINTVKAITTEKEKQLKEAMKIMGLPGWLHWTAWFFKTFIFLLVTITIIVILVKCQFYPNTDRAVFTYSDPFLIFLFLLLYICAVITFCFAISVFFSKATTAATVASMVWFLSYFPFTFLRRNYETLSLTQKLSASIGVNTAMAYGFQLMLMFEGIEEGLQWNNIWKTSSPDDNLTLGYLMIMLIIDALIYLLVAVYVEAIFPGEYGVPQVWYFPLTLTYWCGKTYESEDLEDSIVENECFEKQPLNHEVGIKIKHLTKQFSNKKVAIRDLNLNMYKGQITVLLGHNGAGKTTTMSILTGMITPSSGTAIVEGSDIRKDMPKVRDSFGLCPQHNILFDELTVSEHLYFYCCLKGLAKEAIQSEIDKYVTLLDLEAKKNEKSKTLSGGMKRKLSVGVALCGGSKVVMCDEPTAGMDPASRRALWDLLQSQKHNRTILLTTHYMDEADLLGDRIAIMAGGKLQCCGSSFFLKKKFGAGYHLIMDKTPDCDIAKITNLLQRYIPNLQVETNIGSELSYLLCEEYLSVFEEMLTILELQSKNLNVRNYGISLTTLEEVFMKVGVDSQEDEELTDKSKSTALANGYSKVNPIEPTAIDSLGNKTKRQNPQAFVEIDSNTLMESSLWYNQFLAMLMKRSLSIGRSWVLVLVQNMIAVLFLILAIILSTRSKVSQPLPDMKISLNSYEKPITVLTQTGHNKYLESYKNLFTRNHHLLTYWEKENMTIKMVDETARNTPGVRRRYISGATFNENSITAWFNNQPYHSPPLSLQLIMNAILQKEVSKDYSIEMHNFPLPFTINTELQRLTEGNNVGFQIAFNLGFSMSFVSAFYIMFYIKERACKAKHLQFVSGISVVPFWASAFICDLLTFIFTSILIIITLAVGQQEGFRTPDDLGRVFSVLLYFSFAMLPMMYLASYFFDVPSTGYTRMSLINIFTGVAAMLVVQVLLQPELELEDTANVLHWIFLLVPHYSFSTGIRDIYVIRTTHSLCNAAVDKCVHLVIPGIPNLTPKECRELLCKVIPRCCSTPTNYYDLESPGIGRNVIFSIFMGVVLMGTLLGIEFRIFDMILNLVRSQRVPVIGSGEIEMDDDVLQEKLKIKGMSFEELKNTTLVLKDITKYYNDLLAVNRLCLGVNNYECFGLLGVNGAGKTTTFKILTGDIPLSAGDAWVNGINLKTDMKQVYQSIGYCPQFDGLLDDLTSEETLIIFSLLRGMTMSESKMVAKNLAKELDFYKYLNKKVKQLSGGNKRKLSTAIALVGNPLIVYLDEPTAGMDPATKRFVWETLCRIRDNGKCIILTSHSMEECEALCTRMAIMVNGSFKCLGSTQHLKSKFSDGYTLTIKIRKNPNTSNVEKSDFQQIEEFVKDNFRGATIRERHQELVTFYVASKTLPWSRMFGIMEYGKTFLNIEDYSLGQSNLEQVFLSFAKYQREE